MERGNRTNAVSAYVGSSAGIETNRPLSEAFFAKLDASGIERKEYVFETPAKREALIVDSNVQYNGILGGFA